jgi:hypothetical protein
VKDLLPTPTPTALPSSPTSRPTDCPTAYPTAHPVVLRNALGNRAVAILKKPHRIQQCTMSVMEEKACIFAGLVCCNGDSCEPSCTEPPTHAPSVAPTKVPPTLAPTTAPTLPPTIRPCKRLLVAADDSFAQGIYQLDSESLGNRPVYTHCAGWLKIWWHQAGKNGVWAASPAVGSVKYRLVAESFATRPNDVGISASGQWSLVTTAGEVVKGPFMQCTENECPALGVLATVPTPIPHIQMRPHRIGNIKRDRQH